MADEPAAPDNLSSPAGRCGSFAPLRFAAVAGAVLLLLYANVSLFAVPSYELMYDLGLLKPHCHELGCYCVYRLKIGNTGKKDLEEVVVSLNRDIVAQAVLKPTARNFGKTKRQVATREDGNEFSMELGQLRRSVRVEISFALSFPKGQEPYTWDDIFQGVELRQGKIVRGDADATAFGRFLYAVFVSLNPFA